VVVFVALEVEVPHDSEAAVKVFWTDICSCDRVQDKVWVNISGLVVAPSSSRHSAGEH